VRAEERLEGTETLSRFSPVRETVGLERPRAGDGSFMEERAEGFSTTSSPRLRARRREECEEEGEEEGWEVRSEGLMSPGLKV
jgi:hypothetical protein